MVDVLSLRGATRAGSVGPNAQSFLDFVVQRQSLARLLEVRDRVGVFGSQVPERESPYALQLLQRERSELASGCVPLYICGQCGDLGCGAITVRVTREHDCVVWSDFGYEDNLGIGGRAVLEHLAGVRDFWFDAQQYEQEIRRFVHQRRRR